MRRQRLNDGIERLFEYFEERRHQPFVWGANDCALYWAGAVLALTGVDPAVSFRGYDSEAGAMSIVNAHGVDLRSFVVSLGFPEIHPNFAQRGDGVLFLLEGNQTIFVCAGNGFAYGPGTRRSEAWPMSEAVTAFEV